MEPSGLMQFAADRSDEKFISRNGDESELYHLFFIFRHRSRWKCKILQTFFALIRFPLAAANVIFIKLHDFKSEAKGFVEIESQAD